MPDYGGDYVNIKVKLSLKGNLQYFNGESGDIVEIPFEDYLKGIDAVTEEDVLNLAKYLFNKNRFNLQVIAPIKDSTKFEKILNGR